MVIRDLGLRHLTLTQNVHHVRRERPRPAHVTPCFASGTKRCSLLLRVHPAKLGAFPSSLTSAKKLTPKLGLRGLICACSCKRVLPLPGSHQPAHTRVARPGFRQDKANAPGNDSAPFGHRRRLHCCSLPARHEQKSREQEGGIRELRSPFCVKAKPTTVRSSPKFRTGQHVQNLPRTLHPPPWTGTLNTEGLPGSEGDQPHV